MLGHLSVEGDQAERIVEVSDGVDKGWVSVFDNRGEVVLGSLLEMSLGCLELTTTKVLLVLL